jgi:glycosyltransferase involved in cell wall biosynthesis
MPNVVPEAMAAGAPVVASDVDGVAEVVRPGGVDEAVPGETGLLVRPGDQEALSGAVACLLADRSRREAMMISARQRIGSEFGIERMIEDYRGYYIQIIQALHLEKAR